MWKGPAEDLGSLHTGDSKGPPSQQELQELKDQAEQQQTLIAQLKEMLRKSDQTTVNQEKVAEYANTLTKMNARAKRSQLRDGKEGTSKKLEGPASEKVLLLRKQLEQNKMKLAERGKNQKGMEEIVTQITAQLNDSQQLINQTPLNISLIEDRVEYSPTTSSQELYNILLNKDKRISDLNAKINKLEANVLDLQENIKEKDSVIDARTKAITLMSENLSKKGKFTLDALDETKEQMRKMQENFVEMEEKMKEEKGNLIKQLELKSAENDNLTADNNRLLDDNKRLTEKISELEVTTSDNVMKTEIQTLEAKVAELDELNKTHRRSPSRSGKKGKKGKPQKQSPSQDNKLLETQITSLEKTIEELTHQIKEKELIIESEKDNIARIKVDYEAKISELEKNLSETKSLSCDQTDFGIDGNEELEKLKQQLDESNKNMIKVKAQHKSKLKELNKKIEAFKKISDTNAALVKLEAENSKLTQKIAELEEEKGHLQLNMVESKEALNLEDMKEFESKISDYSKEITTKDQLISSLETSIKYKESEITSLQEKLEELSARHADQVKSDIASVQYEEQVEKLEKEKIVMVSEKENLIEENEKLKEIIEVLNKEKEEYSIKLQLELMDQLDKLSTEKVSSAESIEIVENLTLQEKLELEAYQTPLSSKPAENLAENPELNDSVNQLTEETSELLQKIELFTVERREVMEKMELLSSENKQLTMKLKEVENNRDVLIETYEQLQTEKDELDSKLENLNDTNTKLESKIKNMEKENDPESHMANLPQTDDVKEYKTLIEIQRQEIAELKLQLLSLEGITNIKVELEETISFLEHQYSTILNENEKLKSELQTDTTLDVSKRIADFEEKIKQNLTEINHYKSIVEENKNELIQSADTINDLQTKLTEKLSELDFYKKEIEHLNSVISDLNQAISKLEEENENKTIENMNIMSSELETLKTNLNDNIQHIGSYEAEIQENTGIIKQLNEDLEKLTMKISELEKSLKEKDDVINTMIKQKDEMENTHKSLEQHIKERENNFHQVCDNLKQKCLSLQSQIEANSNSMAPVESKIQDLEKKNKEQLEKMKKIAANLKKKNSEYKELEDNNKEIKEKWQNEIQEKEQIQCQVKETEEKLKTTVLQLQEVETQLIHLQDTLLQKNTEVQILNDQVNELKCNSYELEKKHNALVENIGNYNEQIRDLQNIIRDYEGQLNTTAVETENLLATANNASNVELGRKESEIQQLTAQLESLHYTSKTNSDALQMKINELEMYIENQDVELMKCKEQMTKLEEGLSQVEERRMSLERKAIQLDTELQAKDVSFVEISENEDYLEQRLKVLAEKDALIENRLKDSLTENQELIDRNNSLLEDIKNIRHKLNVAENKLIETADVEERWDRIENDNIELQRTVNSLENDLKKANAELSTFKNESDRNENELQEQLELYTSDRKLLMEQLEVSRDEIVSLLQNQEELKTEINNLTSKLDQQQIEFEENIRKHHVLETEHKSCLSHLDNLNAEVNRLKEVIKDKESELEVSRNEIANVTQLMERLQQENTNCGLLKGSANNDENKVEKTSDYLVGSAVSQVQPTPTTSSLFTWPNDEADNSNFIIDSNITQVEKTEEIPQNTDELLAKIQTLQFMLFNTEKEKENALQQCNDLSNQIAKLVYEKIESQVTTDELHSDTAKTSYKTQTQIVQIPPTSSQPVEEPLMEQTTSFLCFEDKNMEQIDEWSWNPDEAKLEQEHFEKMENGVQKQRISELEDNIRVLEKEKENHLEELKLAQVKSGKLILKLKEFKAKNDLLTAKLKKDDFGDLNDAIQDELKSQVENLEKQIKDNASELYKEKLEKSALLKKVDVLTNANERMIEMKERQDIDIMSWQQKNRELTSKLEQLEWGNDVLELKENKTVPESKASQPENVDELLTKIEELNEIVKDLTLDNEELQTLLEEQRKVRLELEKSKSMQISTDNISETEFNTLLAEKTHIQNELTNTQEKLKDVIQQLQINYSEKTQLEASILDNNITIDGLNSQIRELTDTVQYMNNTSLQSQNVQVEKLETDKQVLENEIKDFEQRIVQLEKDNNNLSQATFSLKEEIISLKTILDSTQKEKSDLIIEKNKLLVCTDELKSKISTLQIDSNILSEHAKLIETLQQKEKDYKDIQDTLSLKETEWLNNDICNKEEIIKLQEEIKTKEEEFESKMSITVQQIIQEWSAHVDQRGQDVAESWKLHLESRENEFVQLEQQLRKEIMEIEERCNILVNENNELRKNVDAEIKNEVDRVSALQQQINEKQHQIDEQTSALQAKESIIENSKLEKSQKDITILELQTTCEDLKSKLQQKNDDVENYKSQIESASTNINKEKEDKLNQLNADLQNKEKELEQYQVVIQSMQDKILELESNTNKLNDLDRTLNALQIDFKEQQNNLQETKLLLEDANNQISQYKTKLSLLEGTLKEKEYKINELTDNFKTSQMDNNTVMILEQEIFDYQQQVSNLNIQLQEHHLHNEALTQEIENYKTLNGHIEIKEAEISRLKNMLQEKESEFNYNLESKSLELQSVISDYMQQIEVLKKRLDESEYKYGESISLKDVMFETCKKQFDELVNESKLSEEALRNELQARENNCTELEAIVQEDEKQLVELKNFIEEQVLKIEELNNELYAKSSNYDALVAQLNIPQDLQVQENAEASSSKQENDNIYEPCNRAELDLALYMLHQRDVRCEELTVELVRLLEERDTLQLRLSNALREKEELKTHTANVSDDGQDDVVTSISSSPLGAVPKSKSILLSASGTELASEATEHLEDGSLAKKLSELKTVVYRRDKTIVDEQDLRRLQQMSILEQHKDEVSKLPPEAAARLVDASYTLSRDVQSPSKVLLNWLWGKSTPKVNNV